MAGFGLFVRGLPSISIRVVSFLAMPPIDLIGRRVFYFLFMTFGCRSLGLPVTAIVLFSSTLLSFGCSFWVGLLRVAICAKVDIWHRLAVERVVTLNVLPGITVLTVDCIAVIICICTDAFDGVIFFIWEVCIREGTVGQRRSLRGSGDRVWLRC